MEIEWRLIEIQWSLASSNQGEIVSTNELMFKDLIKIYEAIALRCDEAMVN